MRRFQIPLGALLPVRITNLIAAVQSLYMSDHLDTGLRFDPEASLTLVDWKTWSSKATPPATRAPGAQALFDQALPR